MPWQQAHIHTTQEQVDALTEWLEYHGACSVTFSPADQQTLLEPDPQTTPLWDKVIITALFDMQQDMQALSGILLQQFGRLYPHDIEIEALEDQVWERAWLERFQPMCFGRGLWICPSSLPVPDEARGQTVIHLDPGLAFGTGTHPTTALCLTHMDAMVLQNKTVIDFGCGSGILAIAAAKLGAGQVWAIDHDVQAIQATRDNAVKNGVQEAILALHSDELTEPLQKVDIVLANILAAPLIKLVSVLSAYVQDKGELVLSGILHEQYQEVVQAYATGFDFDPPAIQDEWVCLYGRKKSVVAG